MQAASTGLYRGVRLCSAPLIPGSRPCRHGFPYWDRTTLHAVESSVLLSCGADIAWYMQTFTRMAGCPDGRQPSHLLSQVDYLLRNGYDQVRKLSNITASMGLIYAQFIRHEARIWLCSSLKHHLWYVGARKLTGTCVCAWFKAQI